MGRFRNAQKFSKKHFKIIKPTDTRLKPEERVVREKKEDEQVIKKNEAPQISSAMFLKYNNQLGPPFHVLLDTNFVNHSIKNKVDMMTGFMDCLYAKVIPYVTDCVVGELEKMGRKFKIALKLIRDNRIQRLSCDHKGTYADDCLTQRVTQHKCYIVATNDKELKNRIRKIPGVPILYVKNHRYSIERMPDAYGAPKL
uniref:rRNA-processing protein FCF1 homolog n=1 Tax=Steinernema glaseri TaxID=37863 RepID=A0A1I7Y5T3_9BILA